MFLRCLDDCVIWLCFDMLPIFILSFGASLKENTCMPHSYAPLPNKSFAQNQHGEGVGVGEGKQLLFLLFPWEVLCVSNGNAGHQAVLLQISKFSPL